MSEEVFSHSGDILASYSLATIDYEISIEPNPPHLICRTRQSSQLQSNRCFNIGRTRGADKKDTDMKPLPHDYAVHLTRGPAGYAVLSSLGIPDLRIFDTIAGVSMFCTIHGWGILPRDVEYFEREPPTP